MIQVIQMIEATEFEPAQDFLEAVKDVKNCSYQAYFDIQNCIEKHEENDSQPIVWSCLKMSIICLLNDNK